MSRASDHDCTRAEAQLAARDAEIARLRAALEAALPVLGDRAVGGRMITARGDALRIAQQARAALAEKTP